MIPEAVKFAHKYNLKRYMFFLSISDNFIFVVTVLKQSVKSPIRFEDINFKQRSSIYGKSLPYQIAYTRQSVPNTSNITGYHFQVLQQPWTTAQTIAPSSRPRMKVIDLHERVVVSRKRQRVRIKSASIQQALSPQSVMNGPEVVMSPLNQLLRLL